MQELVIEGIVPVEQLISTWNTIFEAFLDGMQDSAGKQRIKDMAKLEKYKWEFDLIQLCVKRLSAGWRLGLEHPGWIVDILRDHIRVDGEFNPEDQDGYFRDLQVVLTRSNKLQQKIQDLEAILKITDKDQEDRKPASYEQFDRLVATVSLFCKFFINKQKITTSEFMYLYQSKRAYEDAVAMELAATKSAKHAR